MKTIAAIATPRGVGAVSMIRLSGGDALLIADRIFSSASGKKPSEAEANKAMYGVFSDSAGEFDDGVVTVYRAPRSYTGEDTAELMCHGGLLSTRRLLAACIAAGADCAFAGEYTKRAFINGKLTLSQAEAVGLLIEAKTDACLGISLKQLGGSLSKKISAVEDDLRRLAASVYAYIDYPEEDMTEVTVDEMRAELKGTHQKLKGLADSYRYGRAVSEGVKCVIAGRPNTGKSSLMNLLAGCDRVIVSDEAGTTRDVVTETVRLGEVLLRLSDTAGIRNSEFGIRNSGDKIEQLGIERSKRELSDAELIIAVFDGSELESDEDREVVRLIQENGKADVTVALLNKSDKGKEHAYLLPFKYILPFSAKEGIGVEELSKTINALFGAGDFQADTGEILVNARQHGAISRAAAAVENALTALDSFTQDVAGFDIEEALSALGETDGRAVSEDIVGEIFARFCVGK